MRLQDVGKQSFVSIGAAVTATIENSQAVAFVGPAASDTAPILIYGPPGTYHLRISQSGYSDANPTVRVDVKGVCGQANEVALTVQLTPVR